MRENNIRFQSISTRLNDFQKTFEWNRPVSEEIECTHLVACAKNGPPGHSRTQFILESTSIEKEEENRFLVN